MVALLLLPAEAGDTSDKQDKGDNPTDGGDDVQLSVAQLEGPFLASARGNSSPMLLVAGVVLVHLHLEQLLWLFRP